MNQECKPTVLEITEQEKIDYVEEIQLKVCHIENELVEAQQSGLGYTFISSIAFIVLLIIGKGNPLMVVWSLITLLLSLIHIISTKRIWNSIVRLKEIANKIKLPEKRVLVNVEVANKKSFKTFTIHALPDTNEGIAKAQVLAKTIIKNTEADRYGQNISRIWIETGYCEKTTDLSDAFVHMGYIKDGIDYRTQYEGAAKEEPIRREPPKGLKELGVKYTVDNIEKKDGS